MAATKHPFPESEANGDAQSSRPRKKLKSLPSPAVGGDLAAEKDTDKKKKKDKKRKERGEEKPRVEATLDVVVDKKDKKKKKKHHEKPQQNSFNNHEHIAASTSSEDQNAHKLKKREKKRIDEEQSPGQDSGSREHQRNRPYKQSDDLENLPQADIDAFLDANEITITDSTRAAPSLRPILNFSHLPATKLLGKSPFAAFETPTPIQAASWPFTLSGRDVIGVAETGSGKTMAFALPCVEAILRMRGPGPKAVVVSPTRELAMQTHEQMSSLAALVGLSCVCVFGGASKTAQRELLDRGADVVVATPGRLRDFMSDGTVDLAGARFVVLDEADRMLDKGFEDDIRAILGAAPARDRRQTLMFTATWPASVQQLAASFTANPVKVAIGSRGRETASGAVELQANARIVQRVEVVDPRDKEQRLQQLLRLHQKNKGRGDRILVFCLYKKEATRVEATLRQRGFCVGGIHGDLRQEQRTKSLEAFKSGQTPVLVATDVAARGLDIPEVKLVINVTFPLTIEDYVHRIGRTGRAGKVGEAITLFTEQDKGLAGSLVNVLKFANQPVPDDLLKFGTAVKKKEHGTYGAFFKDVDMTKKSTKITFDD